MASGNLTRISIIILCCLAMLIGFFALINDVHDNYDVRNETNYVYTLSEQTNETLTEMSDHLSSLSDYVQGTKEIISINFIGTITGTILTVILLPFNMIKIVYTFITITFAMMGIPPIVGLLIFLGLLIWITYSIIALILGRDRV